MQTQLHYIILLGLCLVVTTVEAQIAYQGFEGNVADTWTFNSSVTPFNTGGDVWDAVASLGGINSSVGTNFWAAQDVNSPPNGNNPSATLTFNDINVSGFSGVSIEFDYRVISYDGPDDIFYTVILDGVAQSQVNLFSSGSTAGTAYITETINIPNGTNTVGLILEVKQNGGSDRAGFDNFILDGTAVAACPHTVTSIAPTSGTEGTEVTITGTGFTGSSTVTFNGITAAVNFVSATTLVATVPAGATGGAVVVTETTCDVTAGTSFTLLEQTGSCGSVFSDLIISEVYDEDGGALGYVEIYNGTGAAIQLADYRLDRYPSLASTSANVYSFPTMMINDGQVLIGKISTASNASGVTPHFTFGTTPGGINEDDRLELVLISSGAVIDDWHDDEVPGTRGYTYTRNTTITGPNPTYDAIEWTGSGTESTTDLGNFGVTLGGGTPTITAQPSDVSGCAINLSITAAAGGGGALTYQWFFNENDGTATGWTAVSSASFSGATVSGETTTALSISGNLSAFDGYQFYCQVTENGACNLPSEAAQFTLVVERFFRSTVTGDWTNTATWEMASSAAGPWTATCIYPTFDNSDYIHIQNGHVVSVDQDVVVDDVVVETGGTLSINNNRLLTFNNGTGVDLDVQGTLMDNGIGGANGINLGTNSATWTLAANGEIIKTGSSSNAQYRDNYEGGIATIPATATWRFRHDGNNSIVSVIALNMFYPNLYLESTSGSHSFNNASEIFHGAGGFMTVKGNMYIGNSGTGTVDAFNNNTNASLMQILGDLIIGGNGSGGTSKLENNQVGTIGTGIEVHGNLMIHSNGQLDFEDGTAAADGTFRLHGNWSDQNTGNGFAEGESTVEFIGTATQTVDKVSGDENFHNVIVNKASGNLQNNANNMIIENDMTFTTGIVLTSGTAYLLFEAEATATSASDASHVDGPVVKKTSTGTITTFTYPTGDNGLYCAIGIETRFLKGESFIAEYFNTGYGAYNVNTTELDHVSSLEYWTLDESVGGTGENLKVTLHWGAHSNVATTADLRVAHFFTQAPSTVDQWEREGGSPVITGTVSAGTVTSDYVTSFSPFTLSDVVNQISLPLELLRFEGTKLGRTAKLVWEVANEKATDRYCIERSSNAQSFETLACYDATADNALMDYMHIDQTPLVGDNYYRIHQIDHLGVSNYSPTKVLNFEDPNGIVMVYPSPANDQLAIEMPTLAEGLYVVSLIDALGHTLVTSKVSQGQTIHQIDTKDLPAGAYVLQLKAPNGSVYTQKVTIQH